MASIGFVKISDLVEILDKDPCLLEKWSQLCDALDISANDKLIYRKSINSTILGYTDVFVEILTKWVGRNKNRTVRNLCEVLRKLMCINIAEKLEKAYNNSSIICVRLENETNGQPSNSNNLSSKLQPANQTSNCMQENLFQITNGQEQPENLETNYENICKKEKAALMLEEIGEIQGAIKILEDVYRYYVDYFGVKNPITQACMGKIIELQSKYN